MKQLLTLGETILAVGPFEVTAQVIAAIDIIFPTPSMHGLCIVEAELPSDFSPFTYLWRAGELVNSLVEEASHV